MSASFFETPLSQLHHVGVKYANRLERLGLLSVRDLLWHFPTRYEDFSHFSPISDLAAGEQATIQGVVETIDARRSFRRRMIVVQGFIRDETGLVKAVWFNQPYLKNTLTPGRLVNISGKVSEEDGEVYFSHPAYELIDRKTIEKSGLETRHTGRLIPVYPETNGLTSRTIRFLLQPILKSAPKMDEWIPHQILETHHLPEINWAIRSIHFPETAEDAELSRRRFAFEKLFLLQLLNGRRRAELATQNSPKIEVSIPEIKQILKQLPFSLTLSQKKALWEIIQDIEKGRPMNRLLQGDVGSGKTVVAAIAALCVAKGGYQTALLAPTEVLAVQHFETFKKLLEQIAPDHQPAIGLLSAHQATIFYETDLEKELKKEKFKEHLASGVIKIVIGTHAVIEKTVKFKNLGLIIIDEQHRFGVTQRAALVRHTSLLPHFLSMSATPIPRTLTLTIFGDLDLSTITELPEGRKTIRTTVVPPEERAWAYSLIRREIKSGRQAFVICPRIEAPEENETSGSLVLGRPGHLSYIRTGAYKQLEIKSVKEEHEKLSQHIFPDLRLAMLHGQMKPKDKNDVVDKFKAGEIDILVSTSVVEVGVDVPNATIMMIEGAERFGLAQLYQFRGRVGRGTHQSFCLLFTESSGLNVKQRLKAVVEAKNGFELAEQDMRLRGPGQFIGTEQTGFSDLLMGNLTNSELVEISRRSATTIFTIDRNLNKHPLLKERLQEFQAALHLE
jgi:ATP-dependent DNA helicase RecG